MGDAFLAAVERYGLDVKEFRRVQQAFALIDVGRLALALAVDLTSRKIIQDTVTDQPIICSLTCEFSRSRAETVPTARNTVPCYRAFRVHGLVPRETTRRTRARSNAVPVLGSQHLVAATIKRVDETAGADVALGETHRGINDQIWTVAFVEFD